MTTYEQFLKERRQTKARAELVKAFAIEKGIAISTAYKWLYQERHRLTAQGDLVHQPRSDKGIPKLYTAGQVAAVRQALKQDREKTAKEIAAALGVSRAFVARVVDGRYDKK